MDKEFLTRIFKSENFRSEELELVLAQLRLFIFNPRLIQF